MRQLLKEDSKKMINLFFDDGETICISHDSYGYHSIDKNAIGDSIKLISPNTQVEDQIIKEDDICLMAINPVNGFRRDENVTKYRSFMIELDIPYSVCVYSGNKSLHFGIVLKDDLKYENVWRDVAQWILNIVTKADQVAKNPTRSIRFPGNIRPGGKLQALVELNGRIDNQDLYIWLSRYPDQNPATKKIKTKNLSKERPTVDGVPYTVFNKLTKEGIDSSAGRNNEWFKIVMDLLDAGKTEEEIVDYCEEFYTPERDFSEREWLGIIKSACKRYIRNN
jgi:hypothetical protein